MKLNRINIIFVKVLTILTLISINIVAMEQSPVMMKRLDPNYYPFATFVNKTQHPVNILLQSVQYYMSKPYTLKPNESVNLDLSEETGKGKTAPINKLQIGYATGASSYLPMQDISEITHKIYNYKTKAELHWRARQETIHLKVTVEIAEDKKSTWIPSFFYHIWYKEEFTPGIEEDITRGSESTPEFDITKYKKQVLGNKSIKELDTRFINAIKALEPKMSSGKTSLAAFWPLFEKYKKDKNLQAAEGLVLILENGDLNAAKSLIAQGPNK